ncbi:Hypothetical predicted protein [Paramuricea clavata]|uniref:Uncharacterized protein n=1 Tax=Paramuricea clavata TaxID=317549 RepID=A0A6S7H778_PARCT|nr:Hypothetical predicted protein [Paramuricea clavata]
MTNCWKVDPKHRPTFSEIWQDLNDMLSDDETPYIKVYQVKEEGLQTTTEPSEVKMKERHVTA